MPVACIIAVGKQCVFGTAARHCAIKAGLQQHDQVGPSILSAAGAHICQGPHPTCMLVATVQMGLVSRTFPQPARKATRREAGTPMSSLADFVRRCRRATAICLQTGGAESAERRPFTPLLMSLLVDLVQVDVACPVEQEGCPRAAGQHALITTLMELWRPQAGHRQSLRMQTCFCGSRCSCEHAAPAGSLIAAVC